MTTPSLLMLADASKHAIADREGVMGLGAHHAARIRGGEPVGQMPRSEPIGVTSQALPKFESYRCSRNSLNFLTKVSNAYEQFHGIGRLVRRSHQQALAGPHSITAHYAKMLSTPALQPEPVN